MRVFALIPLALGLALGVYAQIPGADTATLTDTASAPKATETTNSTIIDTSSPPNATDTASLPNITDTASFPNGTDTWSLPNATDTGSSPNATDTWSLPNATDTASLPNNTWSNQNGTHVLGAQGTGGAFSTPIVGAATLFAAVLLGVSV
ncbi:hypothetical protein EXIGLDRAFT_756153 [Exidia glandulosa HHB12029]|uniref:Uncharacterized protein n=1 Tax=Exidia glandulosa HHB12029 TaxID=1314781 RepID=A0A165Z9I8_EXIGL|nr:hypothetical protein EXIGLDRAFT_756153 [Exidia glandulosa HHB12029]